MGMTMKHTKHNTLNKKGFTLVEVLVVLAITGMVTTMIFSLLFYGFDVFSMTSKEYELQTNVRMAMQKTDKLVRYSTALFAVPDLMYLDDEWDYVGVSEDGTKIVSYTWNNTSHSHDETILVGPYDGVTFDMGFSKSNTLSTDNTLQLYFDSFDVNGSSRRYHIQSGYESLNALQVIDYGTASHPSKALAFRNETHSYENYKIIVNIAMVLDTSGSMDWDLKGNQINSGSTTKSRIDILKTQASAMVENFAQNSNGDVSINISLVPFGSYAKTPSIFYDIKKSSDKTTILSKINGLNATGSTNTGDGLRRAFYQLDTKRKADLAATSADTIVKNYTITLVDGVTNTHSMKNTSSTTTSWGCIEWKNNGKCKTEGNVTTTSWDKQYYTDSGTIKNCSFVLEGTSCTPGYDSGNDGNADANGYVTLMGAKLSNPDFSTNYMVSFAMSKTTSPIGFIATATATPSERIYYATDADSLGLSFTEIQMSITNELWRFLGPKLTATAQ
jgi:prepilin-type N-terminal cleavage/methylation domain-containing protein